MPRVHNPGENTLSDHDVELIRQFYEQYPASGQRKKAGVFLLIAEKFDISRECAYSICHYRRRCKNKI
jgi:hypothetical protein